MTKKQWAILDEPCVNKRQNMTSEDDDVVTILLSFNFVNRPLTHIGVLTDLKGLPHVAARSDSSETS